MLGVHLLDEGENCSVGTSHGNINVRVQLRNCALVVKIEVEALNEPFECAKIAVIP